MDRSIRGWKAAARRDPSSLGRVDRIIRNTYRTLMTRGMKGCFVTSTDPETLAFLRSLATSAREKIALPPKATGTRAVLAS